MAANFLHGVETITLEVGNRPIQVVKSAVIALVGIAPKGPVEALTIVQSLTDAAQFGEKVPGFTIPQALDAIFKQGNAGTVLVVNVFDDGSHTTAVAAESQVVTNRKAKTAFAPCGSSPAAITNNAGNVTYTEGTDYTIDAFGNIAILSSAIADGATIKITYAKLNAAAITSSVIIGTIDPQNVKTGTKLFEDAYNQFGMTPKIIIAPGYSTVNAVATEMGAMATKYRAFSLIDAPVGTSRQDAITGRGPSGTINFNTSNKRVVLCYPHLKVSNPDPAAASTSILLAPYSQFLAGVMAKNDLDNGYWWSPSNKEIAGILGAEVNLSAAVNDANTDVNLLNEKGITTIFNSFGTGLRTWGNRSAAFPTSTHPSNFIPVQRTADILNESVEYAMLQFVDRPINRALIDEIRGSVNAFIRVLVSRGALIDGECTFDPAKNPPENIAAGQLVFDIAFMPPTPAERITFESYIDITLLKKLLE